MYMGDPLFRLPEVFRKSGQVLGDGNTVVIDGISYPLTTPSAQEKGGPKINLTKPATGWNL